MLAHRDGTTAAPSAARRGPTVAWTRPGQPGLATIRWVPLHYAGAERDRVARPSSVWQRQRFGAIVLAAAQRTGLNCALLNSIIRAESDFDPNAVSPKGAVGLMQLMPATARLYGVTDMTDPETNIHGGARFLADLLRQFNNDLELSLAAYNAGPTTVAKYGGMVPPYPETREYVARVLRYYREYQRVL
ncbi:MAG: lytic transglycosylase domain-containing protein [Magnetococcales bacterium]|nr:lytic transglycosylase domain-containing protein [Magnetococcales bacterium]